MLLLYRTSVVEFGGEAVLAATEVRDAPAATTATGAREAPLVSTRLRTGQPRQDNILSERDGWYNEHESFPRNQSCITWCTV